MNIIFVPGSGLDGTEAWPQQSNAMLAPGTSGTFLTHEDLGSTREQHLAAIHRALGPNGGHLVAHSSGAVAATLAASREPWLVRSLTLFEPACFGAVRGGPEVERHVLEMSPVFDLADDRAVSDADFWVRFLEALGAPVPAPNAVGIALLGRRLRASPPPWEPSISLDFLAPSPTLVITGRWNDLYEEVAEALAGAGACHEILEGKFHRPQDHVRANQLIAAHWKAVG
ncbi:hypothetical protein [Demequina oxidasica]|uniref:hypothetical protein n=1 Tax=Demequina oxidasica TaxID=676199 RepID=UPI00128E7060|nr:hypothetical protein [Demequina oxidasica]